MEGVSLDNQGKELCISYFKRAARNKALAIEFKEYLIRKSIIDTLTTYDEVVSHSQLMQFVTESMASALSVDSEKSNYGHNVVSDFDLFFNLKKDSQIKAYVDSHDLDQSFYEKLYRQRGLLLAFIRRSRGNLILDMDLDGAHDEPSLKKAKTVETVKENNAALASTLSQDNINRNFNVKVADVDDGADFEDDNENAEDKDEDEESTVPSDVTEIRKRKVSKKQSKLMSALIDLYPNVTSSGIYILIHNDEIHSIDDNNVQYLFDIVSQNFE